MISARRSGNTWFLPVYPHESTLIIIVLLIRINPYQPMFQYPIIANEYCLFTCPLFLPGRSSIFPGVLWAVSTWIIFMVSGWEYKIPTPDASCVEDGDVKNLANFFHAHHVRHSIYTIHYITIQTTLANLWISTVFVQTGWSFGTFACFPYK